MGSIRAWLDRTFYPQVEDHWDDKLFREIILGRIQSDSRVLDLGAGAGIVDVMNFRGSVRQVCGIDLDPRVTDNPFLDEGRVSDGAVIPYPDRYFDVVFSDNVLEHLEDPLAVFEEVARVLKPGGHFLFKTPNRYHYMPVIASLTPHSFHQYVNRLRGRDESDTFPTRYRANSRGDVTRLASQSGLEVESLALVESRPEYLRMNALIYVIGIIYERLVNLLPFLAVFRILLVGDLQKPLS